MYWLAPRVRLKVLLTCACVWFFAAALVGKAVGEEVNRQGKDSAVTAVEPKSLPPMTLKQMMQLEKELRRYFEAQERLRWMLKQPKVIDDTGRLQRVPNLWDWPA